MKVTTVGLDLAKQVLSMRGVDEHGEAVLRKRVSRGKLLELFAQLPSSLVGSAWRAIGATRTLMELPHFAAAPTRHSPGTSNPPGDSKLRIEPSISFHTDSRSREGR